LQYHQAGDLQPAERLYRQIIHHDPRNADALHLLGLLAHQVGKHDHALVYIGKAIAAQPLNPIFYRNLGEVYRALNRFDAALKSYRLALQLDPHCAEAHASLGETFRVLGQLDKAMTHYQQALHRMPNSPGIYNNLGNLHQVQGRLDDAVVCYRRALQLDPTYTDAYLNLGAALRSQGRLDEAATSLQQALKLQPDFAEAHANLGTVLRCQGKIAEAITHLKQAIQLKPDLAVAHNNLGIALQVQGEHDEAIACFQRAIQVRPDYAEAHANLGVVLKCKGRLEQAADSLRQAICHKPDYADAYMNLGVVLQAQGRVGEALASFERALALRPAFVEAHWNRALALLVSGNFSVGWDEYEWRWRRNSVSPRIFHQPRWDGSPLDGRTIFVYAEQGLGDTIQFVRYLPLVQAQGGYVIFQCQQGLGLLLQGCAGIDELLEEEVENVPPDRFDVHVPLLSLPRLFHTTLETIPRQIPYITVDPTLIHHWQQRLDHIQGFRVGIVWAGNPAHPNDRNRSCPLNAFAPLAQVSGVTLCSLQKGAAAAQVAQAGLAIENLGPTRDFVETAAVIANLDLVISVDTAVAHLAGAMGRPVWLLLPFAPDWRWLLEREDTPWYPTMWLVRQPRPGDWAAVMQRVQETLITRVASLR
jgi:tetratricopeptide (TPR) repeat protein